MKTVFSILLTIVCTIALPITALMYRVDSSLLQPQPLLRAADQAALFSTIVPTLADELITTDLLQETGFLLLPREEVITLATSTFSPAWIEASVTQLVTEAFRLRTTGTNLGDLNLVISLVEPKQQFLTALAGYTFDVGEEEFNPVLIAAAVPSQINLAQFLLPSVSVEETTSDPNNPFLLKRYSSDLTAEEKELLNASTPPQLLRAQQVMTGVHRVLPALAALCVIAFVMLLVINASHNRHILRWAAAGTFFPGVIFLVFSFVDDIFVPPFLDEKLATIPSSMHGLVRGFVTTYTSQFFDPFLVPGVVGVGIALACIVVALINRHRHPKPSI